MGPLVARCELLLAADVPIWGRRVGLTHDDKQLMILPPMAVWSRPSIPCHGLDGLMAGCLVQETREFLEQQN
jgi:hypothetical protein